MYPFADFHCDTLLKVAGGRVDFSRLNKAGHLDLPRLQSAGFVFQCFAAFFEPGAGQEAALRQTLFLLNEAREKILTLPGVRWVKRGADLRTEGEKSLLALLSIEGADFLGNDPFLLELVHSLGVRLITLVWNGRNSLGDGVGVGPGGGGLTDLGIKALKIMENLGIIADVSHLNEKGFWQLAGAARRPFVASHSNAWALCRHPRNLKDEQIKEIGRNRGLIGMNLCPSFIAEKRKDQSLSTLVQHMSHIASLVPVDCLCLGCDLDGIRRLPLKMKDVRDLAPLPGYMEEAGFSAKEIRAVCSANLLRFLAENLE